MKISGIEIKNFRLLHSVSLDLEDRTTVVVGRNNCGKTSLSDIIRKFLDDRSSFEIEDFSSASYDDFCTALEIYTFGGSESEARRKMPYIELRLRVSYDVSIPDFGALKPFVIDVNDTCTEALVVCRRTLLDGKIPELFDGHGANLTSASASLSSDERVAFFASLRERVPKMFATEFFAEDPNDPTNIKAVPYSAVAALLSLGFVNAQRGLDGAGREADVLAKVLESLFTSASLPNAGEDERSIAENLRDAVVDIQRKIDADFKGQLQRLMPTIEDFGYPGLDGPALQTETQLDVGKLLTNNTKVHYAGYSGVQLPEAYNGLGFRNLLFILFRIVGFYRAFRASAQASGIQLIVIEEPEAHLHPQMQEVFIRQLDSLATKLSQDAGVNWPVQFVVSTHSSHVANEAPFSAIRYFAIASKDVPLGVRYTKVRDLQMGLKGMQSDVADFLHQYLTLTRCDLFFADKAVLIEGTTERLMLPKMMQLLDDSDEALRLRRQYITVMEVGGAYAHLFLPLLEFLELRTLIITDLDSVKINQQKKWKACLVGEGERTSNACINSWFKGQLIADDDVDDVDDGHVGDEADELVSPGVPATEGEAPPVAQGATKEGVAEMAAAPAEQGSAAESAGVSSAEPAAVLTLKTVCDASEDLKARGAIRIAFQVPEEAGGPCGRSFEDAFILANRTMFKVSGTDNAALAAAAFREAKGKKKSKFALNYAIRETGWATPKYIADGLKWLAQNADAVVDPEFAMVTAIVAQAEVSQPADTTLQPAGEQPHG